MENNKPILRTKVNFTIEFSLNEKEAKALDALAGYGTKEFLDCFYKHMGESYLKPYESGIADLFKKILDLRPAISEIDEAKKRLGLKQF